MIGFPGGAMVKSHLPMQRDMGSIQGTRIPHAVGHLANALQLESLALQQTQQSQRKKKKQMVTLSLYLIYEMLLVV